MALDPEVKIVRENERLRGDNRYIRRLNTKLGARGGGYDEFIEQLREVVASEKDFKFKTGGVTKPVAVDKKHVEIAAVAVSDLHLSESVRIEDSNGINHYNSVIAANRLWCHCQKVKSIIQRHQAMYTIKSIWSPLLGDMINGTIHPEMLTTNDLTDHAAVILSARLLKMFYKELKGLGMPIEIDAVVGNHPRTTAKMPTKNQSQTNMDWVAYEMLSDSLADDDQFSLKVWTSQIGMKKIFGHSFAFEHGVDVKNGKEEDLEDRIRAMFDDPVYREATGLKGPSFSQIVIGNLHKPKFLERTIVNGSYTGQNELGQSWRLKPIRAAQLMWGISEKHVRTWMYQVDLTDVLSTKAENPFSEYTTWFMKRHGRSI